MGQFIREGEGGIADLLNDNIHQQEHFICEYFKSIEHLLTTISFSIHFVVIYWIPILNVNNLCKSTF